MVDGLGCIGRMSKKMFFLRFHNVDFSTKFSAMLAIFFLSFFFLICCLS